MTKMMTLRADPIDRRDYLIEIGGNQCIRCGTWRDIFLHHVIPQSAYGTHDLSNLEIVCRKCHFKIENHALLRLGNSTTYHTGQEMLGDESEE